MNHYIFRLVLFFAFSAFLVATAWAQLSPPTVREFHPLGAAPGERLALIVQGTDLDDASTLRFDDPRIQLDGLTRSKERIEAMVALPADLATGPLRFRVVSSRGLSNVGRLMIGPVVPTIHESEPNNGFLAPQVVPSPVAVEGEIQGGDEVDVFAVDMRAGQTRVADAVAERAGSGLDALVTIFSPEGRELASSDDLFGHDAACWVRVPHDGRYLVQIQDAEGRNRDNNLEQATTREYRLLIGALPLVTGAFPPGGRRGETTNLQLLGVNLPGDGGLPWTIPADAALGEARPPIPAAGAWAVRVSDRPEVVEPDLESAADPLRAPIVTVPAAINGRLDEQTGGDTDVYRLSVERGLEGDYAIHVLAARIGSPADPVLAVLDERGDPLIEQDGRPGRDPRLVHRIEAGGLRISVRDRFERGGPRFVYRIEVEPAPPLRPLSVLADLGARTLPRQGALALPLTLDRQGFDGPVTVLAGPLPAGVFATPNTIPANAKGGLIVLSAGADAPLGPFPLRLVARDAPASVSFRFRERWNARGGPRESEIVDDETAWLAVAEPSPIGLTIEPSEVVVPPAGQAEVKVRIDRRGDIAHKPLTIRLWAGVGGLDGFEPVPDVMLDASASTGLFLVKARPGAASRRVAFSARAWFDGSPEFLGADASASVLIVPDPR